MSILPIPVPTIEYDRNFSRAFSALGEGWIVEAGVGVEGEAANYALVWEHGNMRQTKKGPKTVMGVDLESGAKVWLSIQAPRGYVRINEPRYWEQVRRRLEEADFSGVSSAQEMKTILELTAFKIVQDMAEIMKETVPVDTGALQGEIQPVQANDPLLGGEEGL